MTAIKLGLKFAPSVSEQTCRDQLLALDLEASKRVFVFTGLMGPIGRYHSGTFNEFNYCLEFLYDSKNHGSLIIEKRRSFIWRVFSICL